MSPYNEIGLAATGRLSDIYGFNVPSGGWGATQQPFQPAQNQPQVQPTQAQPLRPANQPAIAPQEMAWAKEVGGIDEQGQLKPWAQQELIKRKQTQAAPRQPAGSIADYGQVRYR